MCVCVRVRVRVHVHKRERVSEFSQPSLSLTPLCSTQAGRRVQFATQPVFHEPQPQEQLTGEEDRHKTITPKHCKLCTLSEMHK